MKTTRDVRSAIYANAVLWTLVLSIADAVGIPQPTGPYQVGSRQKTIQHFNPHDPLAPNNVTTAFLATIFYPTLQEPVGAPEPYLLPEVAAYFEKSWNYTSGTLASITSTVQKNASFLEGEVGVSPYPTLLFGPGGGGPPVEGNTILLSELASYGYTVIGLDHPYEQPFMRYPNGTGVTGVDINYYDIDQIRAIYNTRLIDNAVFLEYFDHLVEELKAPFNKTHIGIFGYSLGGAAAFGSMYDESRLTSGLNLDGTNFGRTNGTDANEKKPVFLIADEGHDVYNDITWGTFVSQQTGYVREFKINGSTHHDFCDDTFWKTIEDVDQEAGPIDGNRQVKILNTYVKAFFDFTLQGRNSPLLDGPSADWPEVIFDVGASESG
ncbi:hypothetical protein F4804DRAFT_327812 [Jackrogersella minutella]|nr:hypothetical protein F4804DRAFT_327812 [Jackrogersella minutella]